MIGAYETQLMDSTMGVFGRIIGSNVVRRQDLPGQDDTQSKDVAIFVRLVGDSGGMVLLRMHTATAVKICARLLETDVRSLTPLAADSLLELANMIAGHVACILNNQGFDFTLSIPHLRIGESSGKNFRNLEGLRIPLITNCGAVTIHVALKSH
jgi:CheY-specific phosphatase CheX